jgi:Tc5 transposase DNA-binding domain
MHSKHDKDYEDRLQAALKELSIQLKLSLPLTARRFNVAERTLHNRKNKGRQHPQKAHLHEYLFNPPQKQVLANWICILDDRGILPYLDLVRDKASAIIQDSQPGRVIGKRWLDRFIKRHSELQIKFSQCLECQRSAASNPKVLEHHFKLFQRTMKEYKIKEVNI